MPSPADALAEYVGATSTTPFVESCWSAACEQVANYMGAAAIPEGTVTLARLTLGAELFHRKATKNATAQFAVDGSAPVRVSRDPLVAIRPILDPFMRPAIA